MQYCTNTEQFNIRNMKLLQNVSLQNILNNREINIVLYTYFI